MPDFIWRAAAASGKVEEGQITAVSTAAAMKQLRSQGLTPLSLAEVGAMGAPGMAGAAAGIGAGAGPATGLGGFAQVPHRRGDEIADVLDEGQRICMGVVMVMLVFIMLVMVFGMFCFTARKSFIAV